MANKTLTPAEQAVWNNVTSETYSDVMKLRCAYNQGIKTPESTDAARIYLNFRRKLRMLNDEK